MIIKPDGHRFFVVFPLLLDNNGVSSGALLKTNTKPALDDGIRSVSIVESERASFRREEALGTRVFLPYFVAFFFLQRNTILFQ